MSGIRISGLVKRFGSVVAVNNVSLEIGEGEFVSLLGPSGCGKTTILRCLAGLETPDAGVIQIGDDVVFSADTGINIPPGKRGLGMVFQSYALWPHMSVFNNVSFGLELMGIPREKRAQIVADALNLVGIGELAHRYPSELSGGQQQRVALARAVVTQPKILLLDEPLSNLDAKLRMQMRAELQRLHRKLKCTVVYVTHDQLEAMTLSTKIVLLKDGVLQQYDEPHRIYEEPVNCWVADFVGNPAINRLAGTVLPNGLVQLDCGPSIRLSSHKLDAQQRIQIGLRPEEIQLREDGSGIILKGTVHSVHVLLVVPAAASTTAELYEAAKAEGKVVIYGFSSRIFDVKDSFEAEYPGITVEAYDMSSFELLEKLEREYAAGIRNADVIFVSDSEGTLRNSLLPQGIVENYVPEELIDVIPESLREPLLVQFIQMNVPYYNPKVFSEQPISSWWDLTLPEWRGKIIMNDPLRSAETLGMLITMVQRGDEMAIAYEERFGEPIETRPNENAGHEFIRRLAANDPVFMTSGGDVVSAISASDQPLIGLASSPKLRDVDTKGLSLAVAWDITPAVSVTTNAYLALAADAPHPNAARLLIHWMMGDSEGGKGYAPFHVQGSWSSRTDVPPPPNTPDLSSLTYWEDDPEYVWTNGLQIRDFWLTVNR